MKKFWKFLYSVWTQLIIYICSLGLSIYCVLKGHTIDQNFILSALAISVTATLLLAAGSANKGKETIIMTLMTFSVTALLGIMGGGVFDLCQKNPELAFVYVLIYLLSVGTLVGYYLRGDMSRIYRLNVINAIQALRYPAKIKSLMSILVLKEKPMLADEINKAFGSCATQSFLDNNWHKIVKFSKESDVISKEDLAKIKEEFSSWSFQKMTEFLEEGGAGPALQIRKTQLG